MHLGLHRQCGFSWLSTVTWKIRLPLMLEEARDSLSFLAWRPMLNFLVNCILNEQFSSASLNGIIWMAWWSTGFISITIYVCQHVSLVVFTHRGMGQRGCAFSHSQQCDHVGSGTSCLSVILTAHPFCLRFPHQSNLIWFSWGLTEVMQVKHLEKWSIL